MYTICAGVTKICNNLALAISMVGTAEAMHLVSGLKSWYVVLIKNIFSYLLTQ
jgi:hypothetical protein